MHRPAYCPRCGGATIDRDVEGAIRPVCGSCGFTIFLDPKLAVAIVIESGGKLLLGLRGEGTREPGKWSFPAGFVDRGERIESAARRELQEETGLVADDFHLLDLISREGEPVVLAVYAAAGFTGVAKPGDDLAAIDWFNPDNLPELAFPHDPDIVERWKIWWRNADSGRDS